MPSLSPCSVNSWNSLCALNSWTQNCLFLRFRRVSEQTRGSWLIQNSDYGNFGRILLHGHYKCTPTSPFWTKNTCMNFVLSGFTFRRKFLWSAKLIHFHRVLYTTLPKRAERRGNSFHYFILERLTCKVLLDIMMYIYPYIFSFFYISFVAVYNNIKTKYGLLTTKHAAVKRPILEMHKKFVLRDINHVRLLRQNRIFLERFSWIFRILSVLVAWLRVYTLHKYILMRILSTETLRWGYVNTEKVLYCIYKTGNR